MPTIESVTLGPLAISGFTITADFPATVNAGDILLLLVKQRGTASSSSETFTTPTDFTARHTHYNNFSGLSALYAKVAAGTEGGGSASITTSLDLSTAVGRAICVRISGGIIDGSVSSGNVNAASNTISSPTLTPTVDNCLILALLNIDWDGSALAITQPSGYTEDYEGGGGFNPSFGVASLQQTTAVATGALDWTSLPDGYAGVGMTAAIAPAGLTFSAGPTVDQITQGGARIRATGDLP